MPKDFEAQLKRVKAGRRDDRALVGRRDTSLTGGERAETEAEKRQSRAKVRKPREAPIIERTP